MPPNENERANVSDYILQELRGMRGEMAELTKEVNDLKVQIASKPVPARPCEYFAKHIEDHRREEEASRAFWYQRLGNILDALWKPLVAILLLGAVLSGAIKIDVLQGVSAPVKTEPKEVQK